MLDHTGTGACRNEHRGGGDVQKTGLIPTRAAKFEKRPAAGTVEHGTHRASEQNPGEAGEFAGALSAIAESDQKAGLRLLGELSIKEKLHG